MDFRPRFDLLGLVNMALPVAGGALQLLQLRYRRFDSFHFGLQDPNCGSNVRWFLNRNMFASSVWRVSSLQEPTNGLPGQPN
jgi:hypothetical protein